jgi:transporter family-2 protein
MPARAIAAPWWVWLGGICNAIFVLAAAVATQKIGSGVYTVIIACSAVILSMVLDQFGLLGLHQHSLSLMRLLGGMLALSGIALVSLS